MTGPERLLLDLSDLQDSTLLQLTVASAAWLVPDLQVDEMFGCELDVKATRYQHGLLGSCFNAYRWREFCCREKQ